jgi:asparagine synthase (glutamine-hydrolysing)
MAQAVAHRGPDGDGEHLEAGFALTVRRLSIVDAENGAQPVCNESGTVWAACNGELYGYPEVRASLIERGHRLTTHCDSEVWPHLYEDDGANAFALARGQFAVAIWDRSEQRLLLARDRAGICPMYYAESNGWFLFGSEVKAILASGLIHPRPDRKAIDYLFALAAAPRERSFFEGIRSLPPGHYLEVSRRGTTLRRYWELEFPPKGEELRSEETDSVVEQLEEVLRRAVRRRLRADAPIASYLSGGVDSSLALGLAAMESGRPIQAFSISLDRAGPDERTAASRSANTLGCPLEVLSLNQSAIASALPFVVHAAEGPVLDLSNGCLLRLANLVHRRGYEVALTGEGADEIFAGYSWYKAQRILALTSRPSLGLLPAALRAIAHRASGSSVHAPKLGPLRDVPMAQLDFHDALARSRARFYSDAMWNSVDGFSAYEELQLPIEKLRRWDPLHQTMFLDFQLMLPGHLLLGKGDRVAMHSAVEMRYPFLDEDLIAYVSRLAPDFKLRGLRDKWILRRLASRYLPARVARRPKLMFSAKLSSTLLGPHRPPWVDQLLSPESLTRTGYFDPDRVMHERRAQRWRPPFSLSALTADPALVGVVATQLWHHHFLGGGLCELPTNVLTISAAVGPPLSAERPGRAVRA